MNFRLFMYGYSKYYKLKEDALCIGIDASNKKYINDDFSSRYNNKCYFYAYYDKGPKYSHKCSYNGESYGKLWEASDTIKMELNTNKKTLKFYVNNVDQGIAFDEVDFENNTKYNMAIFLYQKNDSIQLIDFQQIYQ